MRPRADSWVPALTGLLPGARAPFRFLGGLRRQCAAIALWRRSAAWLLELLAQRPQLLPGPLFGHTLAAAVQGGEERAETPSPRTVAATQPLPTAPEGRGRGSRSSNSPGPLQAAAPRPRAEAPGRRRQAFAGPQVLARDRAPLPGQSRTRVEGSLLTALAGGLPVAAKAAHLPARLTLPRSPAAGERHLPVAAESGRLVQQLAQRLRSKLLPGGTGPAASRGAAPVTAPVTAAGLSAQWALPLAGQRVSGNYLAALLQTSKPDAAGQPPGVDRHGRPAAADPAWNGAPSSKGPFSAQGNPPAVAKGVGHEEGPHPPAADRRSPRDAAAWLSSRRRDALATVGVKAGESSHTSGAAEPGSPGPGPAFSAGQTAKVFDPRLAPLPLPAGEQTSGSRFFAALRRQPPSAEGFFDHPPAAVSAAAADDLEELTAKLQRILEEQARRHGIDV